MYARLLRNLGANARCFATEASPKVRPISKILISNRGEIACRVIRTARKLGVRTVAVFSDPDEESLHTQLADEAYRVGEAPSSASYLRGERILDIAKRSGAQAIHPGYGFLSESVEFAELCQREGIIFMGPPSSAIRDMGIKSTSKAIMAAAGVPIINGYHGEDQSDECLQREADIIGFPLMIKAVRGGGGKGMRIAEKRDDFLTALNSARTESEKSFGDSSVLLERYVRSPRHVEVQVFADQYGDAVYLWERDCSVQRRHQKIIEEAPAPGLSEDLRRELGEAAVRAAKAVGYVGAGTVEFILDKEDLSFHFMEMNTRLQVEHPITEMITGTDLVEWQIRIAAGEPLPLTQSEITRRGHAFEARIYAENPRGGFLPGAGPLRYLSTPQPSDNVRVETGVREGDEVSVHYDPMIAKLVVWGENRTQALNSLVARLGEYHISGLDTNIKFLIDLASHPEFQLANVHTGFIDEQFDTLFPPIVISPQQVSQAALALVFNELQAAFRNGNKDQDPFVATPNARLNYSLVRRYQLKANEKVYSVAVKFDGEDIQIQVDNGDWQVVKAERVQDESRLKIRANINSNITTYNASIDGTGVCLFLETGKVDFELAQPKFLSAQADQLGAAGSRVVAPMPGILEKVLVKPGDQVKKGENLAVLIAMKMEHILKAPRDATIKSIGGAEGDNVAKGAAVITFVDESVAE
ncbi:methylcrotonoyl-CoA carboxylase subunit alpha, mitochondrial [Drosophila santomea]|uniref:methylcrotonoyl-CoA carboxylase subunit alpha, mitochondrial n=1 Tax=Drosophila santomea TaxID=129105 RepID=UPI0019543CE8|nr:methylcrotonoyl-CoA carboxylase subunit alpha, mitochondrial [Drosophila santomea]XP_039492489.1 methylcrotonoyl-CoA carboxylase subunit alpha, mitochondrial [Drosophila santomea]